MIGLSTRCNRTTALGGHTRVAGVQRRRWLSGEDMDAPIRGYVQYHEDADGHCEPMSARTVRPQREKPFAAEYALLAELGLSHD
jgi:hypothetical protein